MELVLGLHGRIATAIVLYLTVVGLWGLFLGIRGSGPTANFTGALVIAAIAAVAQGLCGVALRGGRAPAENVAGGAGVDAVAPPRNRLFGSGSGGPRGSVVNRGRNTRNGAVPWAQDGTK